MVWLLRLSLSVGDTSGNTVSEHKLQGETPEAAVEEAGNLKEAVGVTESPASSSQPENN